MKKRNLVNDTVNGNILNQEPCSCGCHPKCKLEKDSVLLQQAGPTNRVFKLAQLKYCVASVSSVGISLHTNSRRQTIGL